MLVQHLRLASRRSSGLTTGLATGLTALTVLLAVFGAQHAQAGVFDDEEARRQTVSYTHLAHKL